MVAEWLQQLQVSSPPTSMLRGRASPERAFLCISWASIKWWTLSEAGVRSGEPWLVCTSLHFPKSQGSSNPHFSFETFPIPPLTRLHDHFLSSQSFSNHLLSIWEVPGMGVQKQTPCYLHFALISIVVLDISTWYGHLSEPRFLHVYKGNNIHFIVAKFRVHVHTAPRMSPVYICCPGNVNSLNICFPQTKGDFFVPRITLTAWNNILKCIQ